MLFFKRSKYSVFVHLLFIILFVYFLAVLASACVFRLFGNIGLVINSIFITISGIFFHHNYYKHWDDVWNSHSFYNENTAIDQENARFDYLNGFNIDESKVNKEAGKKGSNPALVALISSIAPIGVGIGLIFSKFNMHKFIFIIIWIGANYTILGFTKGIAAYFYNYRKLAYFEKKLGKPIINGLLE